LPGCTPRSDRHRDADPAKLAAFWCLALGYAGASPPGFGSREEWLGHVGVPPEEWDDGAFIEDPGGTGPGISFLKVPEGEDLQDGTPDQL
jgi:hypothetical protein